jgi:hypothetical protein
VYNTPQRRSRDLHSRGTAARAERSRTKVSHYAQKKLKSLLKMAALSAKKHDPELKQYFDRKVAEENA